MSITRADSVQMPPPNDPDFGFWSQTEVLMQIRSWARGRRSAPYAVLACILRQAVACIEPHVVHPPTIGGYASVNLFTTTAGASGQGKGAADSAGFAAVNFHDINGNDLSAARPSIGSGEGLARLFRGGKDQAPITRAHLLVPEVKTLEALMGRQGSTLVGELLKAYMGEGLGFHNSSKDTTTAVADQSYRLCLGIGVQPENAGFFLSRAKDGFPQRFLWVPAIDPYAPDQRPEPVPQLDVLIPEFKANQDDWHVVQIPDAVRSEIDAFRVAILRDDPSVDPLDGHLKLTQLKCAFALAVLHGRAAVDEADWSIAGTLIDLSVEVRTRMGAAVADARKRQNTAKAVDEADRTEIIAARMSDRSQKRVVKAIISKLLRVERCTRRDLYAACSAAIRGEFDGVFDTMIDQQVIVHCESEGKQFSPTFQLGSGYASGVAGVS